MRLGDFLRTAAAQLEAAGITTARLDALLLASDELRADKSWVLAHDDQVLTESQLAALQRKAKQRLARLPMAYVRGKQEFYGREFTLTTDTLIPRPESEMLIEVLQRLGPQPGQLLVDVGTGSGCLAITAALEFLELTVQAVDISQAALRVAATNAAALGATVQFSHSNLLASFKGQADFILANLPYVDRAWSTSAETMHEPALALFANENGLAIIFELLTQAPQHLRPGGSLLLEADPRQHQAIIRFATRHDFVAVTIDDFIITLARAQSE